MKVRTPFTTGALKSRSLVAALACSLVVATLAVSPAVAAAQPSRITRPAAVPADAERQIHRFFSQAASQRQFNGAVLVAQGGQVIYQGAFGLADMEWATPNTVDTRFEIASITKPMTAIMIMQLVEEGKVRLDGRVSDYIPFYPREAGERITIDQLLTHTSGLQEDMAFPDDAVRDAAQVALVNADVLSNDSLVALISRRSLRFEPGTGFGYSSDAYAVLGAVIEHVTQMDYWEALRRRVFDRAGMRETGIAVRHPIVPKRAGGYAQTFGGYENAPHIGVTPAGGLYSTLSDLYRFDRALYGTALLQTESKERLFATRSAITAYGWKTSEDVRPDGSRRKILRTTGGLPGFGALLIRSPTADRVVVLLANTRDLEWRFDDFAVVVSRILDGERYSMPRQSVAEVLAATAQSGASAAELRTRFAAMRRDTSRFVVTETTMNRLGYYLFRQNGRLPHAIEVFLANVDAFPQSANVYDSLGEALLAHGDTARAIVNYRRSLELDPRNTGAADILKRIGAP